MGRGESIGKCTLHEIKQWMGVRDPNQRLLIVFSLRRLVHTILSVVRQVCGQEGDHRSFQLFLTNRDSDGEEMSIF